MDEREALAQKIAGDNYGLSLEDPNGFREGLIGRLKDTERSTFEAGWEAARQYYVIAHARIAEAMRPTGGRMWTEEQHACFAALTACAAAIRTGNHVQD